jgi:hypothetical protein
LQTSLYSTASTSVARFVLVGAAAAVVLSGNCQLALAHGTSTISIHVGLADGGLAITNGMNLGGLQVFADHSDVFDDLGESIVPGWDVDAALDAQTLRLAILSPLFYWSPAEELSAATSDALTLRRLYFPTGMADAASVDQTTILDPETILWDAATVGQSHHIMRYEIPVGAPQGAYGVLVRLEDFGGLLAPSNPALLIFNNGLEGTPRTEAGQLLDASELGRAVAAIGAMVVPEPGGLALAVCGGACFALLACKTRKRTSKIRADG